ncbi:MAG TPA: NAD(P)/FAD-dependent oxidoreductase [Burkholderiales bacterium]|nr:NAD(P)/FAD-dependent oxidoreductase [Burkholderiales bacterium]
MNFDLVVIGSGPAGYKTAASAAHHGAKVALVERGLPGGNCLNRGCIPKKTLVYLASLIEDVANLQGRGIVGAVRGDYGAAVAHKDQVVAGIRDGIAFGLRRLGIELVRAKARLRPGLRVALQPLDGQVAPFADELSAGRIAIATGSVPRRLDACPTDNDRILDSSQFMRVMRECPDSMLFIGGGTVGVELGYLMHQFGARVCIAEPSDRLLDRHSISERASGALERKLARLAIEVRKGVTVAASSPDAHGVNVIFSDGARDHFEKVLVAIGRRPRTEDLGLAEAGVELDEDGYIRVSEYLETSVPGIYATGDVKRGPMTANAALHDAKVAAANIASGNHLRPNYHKVPIVINSALEIAAVGLTEDVAEAAGFEPDVARSTFGGSGKARAHHDTEGFIEVVHDAETGQLLGGCIVGPEAGEQIHMLAAACQSARGLWFFKDMSYSHPSWCEELETAVDPYTSAFVRSGKEIFERGLFAPAE